MPHSRQQDIVLVEMLMEDMAKQKLIASAIANARVEKSVGEDGEIVCTVLINKTRFK